MLISVTCDNCKKHYQVDAKLGGKKVKCKECGHAIAIPKADAPLDDDLLAGLNAAAAAEQGAPKPVSQRPGAGITPPAPVPPPMPVPSVHGSPPAPVAPPGAARLPKVMYVQEEERSYLGYRRNVEHANTMLGVLDRLTVVIGQVIFWIYAALLLLAIFLIYWGLHMINQDRRDNNQPEIPGFVFLIMVFIPLITFGLYLIAKVPLCTFAANLAGKALMFELPEEPRWRFISVDTLSAVFIVAGILIMVVMAALGRGLAHMDLSGAAASLACFTLPLSIPIHFLLTWLVLRLKFLEALLAWLFGAIATVLATGIYFILLQLLLVAVTPRH